MIKEEIKKKLNTRTSDWFLKNEKRIYFKLIDKSDLKDVISILYKDYELRFITASGVDNESNLEVIYHFSSDKTGEVFSLRVFLEDKEDPELDSVTSLFKSALWIEREINELLGIKFKGHPSMKHLLLKDDWPEGKYPLRKDYIDE